MNTETRENEAVVEPEPTVHAEVEVETEKVDAEKAEPEPARAPPPPDYRDLRIQTLERTLAEREATLHSYIRAHKKAEADFEAYRQRLERDRERELVASKAKFVEKLLDVDDNLERTVAAARQGGADAVSALIKGVEMVHKQFVERLSELGLERVTPTGSPFDPTSMEALGVVVVDDPAKHDTVVLTLRSGYRMGEREIRPALVQVGKFMN
jgi:molecular chaperone GrpE